MASASFPCKPSPLGCRARRHLAYLHMRGGSDNCGGSVGLLSGDEVTSVITCLTANG